MPVQQLSSDEGARAFVLANTLALLEYRMGDCDVCEGIAPLLEGLSARYPDVAFAAVDVERVSEAVPAVPTFRAYRAGALAGELTGAQRFDLEPFLRRSLGL